MTFYYRGVRFMQVNVENAKTNLSKYIRLVETGREAYVTIARNGRPVAKIVPVEETPVSRRIGVAKGKFHAPEDFDANNDEAAAILMEGII